MTTIDLLHQWIKRSGAGENILDSTGRVCSFIYNDHLPVSVEAPPYCDDLFVIMELAEEGSGEMRRKRLETAMKINAYGLETRGGILGWDAIGERLTLSYRITAENSSAEELDNIISNLLDVAEQIKPELALEKEQALQKKLADQFDPMFNPITP